MNKLLLLFLFLPLPVFAERTLPAPPVADPIRYRADHFEYSGSTGGARAQIHLSGNVEIKESTWTLRAGDASLDMESRLCKVRNGFELDDGLSVLKGKRGEFDLEEGVGSVDEVRAEYDVWRVWARRGRLDNQRRSHFRSSVFTSCAANPPDYHFRASGLHVKPKNYMFATNVVFFIRKVPIFWSPILYKPLKDHPFLRTRFTPSYDKRNGGEMRSTTEFNFSKAFHGKLFLDYHTQPGWGMGGELGLHDGPDSRGALYGYRIRENGSGDERWTVLGNAYHTVSHGHAIQARLQGQSDPTVNNDYLRSNAFRVTQELVNSVAFTRTTPWATTRISYARTDFGNVTTRRFSRQTESSPRLDWRTAQLSFKKLPTLFTLTGFADNNFNQTRGFQQKSAGVGVEGTQAFNVRRGLSITPRVTYRQEFEDKRIAPTTIGSSQTLRDVFIGYYGGGGNVRLDTPAGDWDMGYTFERRLKPDAMGGDFGSPDYGVERNLLTLQDTLRPHRRVLFRLGSGYDFRRFRTLPIGFRSRVQPITTDFTWFGRRGWSLSLRNDYTLDDGNRAFLTQADWGERDANFSGFGVSHTKKNPDTWYTSVDAGWKAGKTWRVAGALRSLVNTPGGLNFRGYRIYEKELELKKRLHDFDARLLVRFRPGNVQEVLFRIDLRTVRKLIRRKQRKDWEKEWFPWRKGDGGDRE